ncbi:MAG: DUF4012 domain-containing protein [Actinomycetota bacterium]|nr:DUF4012 domain-containing protein [Actinomycetota bacterium]
MRRNTILRRDLPVVWSLAAVAAVLACLAGCKPTGQPVVDALLTASLAVFTVWLGASASWWSLCAAGWVAALAAGTVLGVAVAVVALAIGLYLGDRRRNLAWVRSLSVAMVLQVLLRLEVSPFFGFSAMVAAGVLLFLWGVCSTRRRDAVRRRLKLGAFVTGGVALAAAAAFAGGVSTVQSDLESGYQRVLDGLEQLQDGDADGAAVVLHEAADQLASVADTADSVWTQPARLLPVVAQHRNALADIITQAASAAEAAATALDSVDLDSLTVEQGMIDVDAIAALATPLAELHAAVEQLRRSLDDADSPWLVTPAADRLHRYQERAEQAATQAEASAAAAALGPDLLGASERRRYLVGFLSPAEARGAMGVMGNYAVIEIDHGLITRTDFGRTNSLSNEIDAAGGVELDLTEEFRGRYGRYFLDENGLAAHETWSNATMSPDVPTVASIMAQVWEATGHDPLDGVFLIDPAGLAGLLEATGPTTVDGLDEPLSADNVEQFLYIDQYKSDTPERAEMLEKVAAATLEAMLGGQLPAPQELARVLGPAATGGDLVGWARRPEEQDLMRLIGMNGALPAAPVDGIAVVTNNASANKIDSFLLRTITYDAVVRGDRVHATLTVQLHNSAPTSGYPTYVIGSEFIDMPVGTNRTLLSVYSPLQRSGATLDGTAVALTNDTELGWNVNTVGFDIAPGQTRTLVLQLVGAVGDEPYELVVRPQPIPTPDQYSIHVAGDVTIDHVGTVERRSAFSDHRTRALTA